MPADDKTAAEHAALEAAIFDDGSRALAGALAPDANLGISRNEGSLMLAFSHLAQRAIEDVYADCGDTDAGVLSSNVGQYIAREVHEVLFGEPDGVLRDGAAVRRVAPDRETLYGLIRNAWTTGKPGHSRMQTAVQAVDALLASGVLGVPADQRTADRETIARAMCPMVDTCPDCLTRAGAVLAVLVPADQVRAETADALADGIQALHPGEVKASVEWLRARAAEYRKAAGA